MPIKFQQIPPPANVSSQPDKATKKGLSDYTGNAADERVLHINLWFFKYGTNDKAHAAAIVFSLILLMMIIGIMTYGGTSGANAAWADKMFNWLGGTFLFISGVALGSKGGNGSADNLNDDTL